MSKKSHIIIALGSNSDARENLSAACTELSLRIPGITFSQTIPTEPVGINSPNFFNCLAEGETTLTLDQLQQQLKQLEQQQGDTPILRKQNIVRLDADLLLYGKKRLHQKDWSRAYIIKLLAMLTTLLLLLTPIQANAQHTILNAQLERAIEYFQSEKYQEALLLFTQLEKQYILNPRFQAYIALCHYHQWNYAETALRLDSILPQLDPLAPHEKAVYYYACAESHFNLQQYQQAIPFYEQFLLLCYDNEKPDTFFRLGFCHMFTYDTASAYEYLKAAEIYFQRYRAEDEQGRLAQTRQMIKGLEDKLIRQGGYFVYDNP